MFVSGSSKDDDSNASGLAGHQSVPLQVQVFRTVPPIYRDVFQVFQEGMMRNGVCNMSESYHK